jgi:hypothetical protein
MKKLSKKEFKQIQLDFINIFNINNQNLNNKFNIYKVMTKAGIMEVKFEWGYTFQNILVRFKDIEFAYKLVSNKNRFNQNTGKYNFQGYVFNFLNEIKTLKN